MTLHPLLQRLLAMPGATLVDQASLAGFAEAPGEAVLFFSGDPVRFPEALDVAVVLPELRAACVDRFRIGVVDPAAEDAIARRYGSQRWPALVFLRDGAYLDTVAGMQDWDAYLGAVARALAKAPSRAPGVGIPVVGAGAAASNSTCH